MSSTVSNVSSRRAGALVAVVGRPNVGKSALVNRLSQLHSAIVHPEEGVTRDRNYLHTDWRGRPFTIIDTGGIAHDHDETIAAIKTQALLAVDEADVIVMVVDRTAGITQGDREVTEILRKSKKPIILVANKVDEPFHHELDTVTFFELGLGTPMPVSALHGIGTGDLLDSIVDALPPEAGETQPADEKEIAIAIIGRPNVGKSSLLNKLLGEQRSVVSPIPGTTRDAVDSIVKFGDSTFRFIDTAGIRKKGRGEAAIEYYSWVRTVRTLEQADIALILIDAESGATEMDQKVAELANDRRCAVIVLINKWDTLKNDPEAQENCERSVERRLWFFGHVPFLNISALSGRGLNRLYPLIDNVAAEYNRKVTTGQFNALLQEIKKAIPMPAKKGKSLKIDYGTQVRSAPPAFLIFCNDGRLANQPFRSYMERRIREKFGFSGSPILLSFKGSK